MLVGTYVGIASPARRDTDHVGVDLVLPAGRTMLPLDASSEHALVAAEAALRTGEVVLTRGRLGYLGVGRDEVLIETTEPTRVLMIGGKPFTEPLLMWWNYVARSRCELTAAHRDWMSEHERFGHVASPLARAVTGGPPWSYPSS